MMRHTIALVAGLALSVISKVPAVAQEPARVTRVATSACAALAAIRWPDLAITAAVVTPPGDRVAMPHCRISGVIGREIRFELLLPDDWNRRLVMGGGGGFVGSVENQAQASVNRGYATAGTDTGHQGDGMDASWALADLERQVNFGHLAVHRTAVVAKALVEAYYGSAVRHAYFVGCSNGGRQALMEAQRYPTDFDGIVAGAPAFNVTNLTAAFVKNSRALYPDPLQLDVSPLPTATLSLLAAHVLTACDARDGITDRVVDDPRQCRFDPADVPVCPGDQPGPTCVTRAQLAAITQIYAPLMTGDRLVYHGQPVGGEAGWAPWITGPLSPMPPRPGQARPPSMQWGFATEFFRYFVFGNPSWNYRDYDFATWERDTHVVRTVVDADNPDLSSFVARGKLIVWHGWSDPALNARSTIDYYDRALAKTSSLRDNGRLFLLPGVQHCGGGDGPDSVDWIQEIADWVEKGRAPERVNATTRAGDTRVRTRPVCAYPMRTVYKGAGSTDDPGSFECRTP